MKLTDVSVSSTITIFLSAMILLMSGVPAPADETDSAGKVRPPIPVEISLDCLNTSGIDPDRIGFVMRELRGMSGIRIIAIESTPESLISVDMDRTRANIWKIGPDEVIRSIVAWTKFPVVSRDENNVTFEYIRGKISIEELGRVEIVNSGGDTVRLSDIAIFRLEVRPYRRPYMSGDRFVIIRVAMEPDFSAAAEEALRRRFGGLAWVKWGKIDRE